MLRSCFCGPPQSFCWTNTDSISFSTSPAARTGQGTWFGPTWEGQEHWPSLGPSLRDSQEVSSTALCQQISGGKGYFLDMAPCVNVSICYGSPVAWASAPAHLLSEETNRHDGAVWGGHVTSSWNVLQAKHAFSLIVYQELNSAHKHTSSEEDAPNQIPHKTQAPGDKLATKTQKT